MASVLNQPESWMGTLAFFCLFAPLCMYEQELSCSFFVMPIVRLKHILSSVQTLIEACKKSAAVKPTHWGLIVTYDIPIRKKANLFAEEAASYFNNSINKLRQMTGTKGCEKHVLWVGNRRLIKQKAFESHLQKNIRFK